MPISVVNVYKRENTKLSPTIQLNKSKHELNESNDDSPNSVMLRSENSNSLEILNLQ